MRYLNQILLLPLTILLCTSTSYPQDSLNVSKLGELYSFWDNPGDIVIVDSYAYVADKAAGIRIMDVTDPAEPVELSYLQLPADCDALDAGGGFLYAACHDNRIRIYDLSDPMWPSFVSDYALDTFTCDLHLTGTMLHLVNDDDDYIIVDVSDPWNPATLGGLTIPGYLNALDVIGNYTYITGLFTTVVMDVSDPTQPAIVTYPQVSGYGVKILGDHAYFMGYTFTIMDISDPANPTWVGSVITGDENYCVQVIEPYAYVGVYDS
jgi:hypothetical protein